MKNKKTVAIAVMSSVPLLFISHIVLAQYVNKELVPGQSATGSFTELLGQIYNFSIGAAAILAMIMIGAGAFMYIVTSAGNASKIANAKDMIFSAIFGLVIAMIAWITLFLINPDLVRGNVQNIPNTSNYIHHRPDGLH